MRLISTRLRNRKFAFMIDGTSDLQGLEQTAVVYGRLTTTLILKKPSSGGTPLLKKMLNH